VSEAAPFFLYIFAVGCGVWALVYAARTGRMPWGTFASFDISRERFPTLFWIVASLCALMTLAALAGLLARLAGL